MLTIANNGGVDGADAVSELLKQDDPNQQYDSATGR